MPEAQGIQKIYEDYSNQIKEKTIASAMVLLAAELGFEPRQTESESVVLTVTQFRYLLVLLFTTSIILSQLNSFVNTFLKVFLLFFLNIFSKNY